MKRLSKKTVSLFLAVLIILSAFPLAAFAESPNLGKVTSSDINVSATWHYGHEVHTATVGGNTYPLFCIEYNTTSPSEAYLKARKAGAKRVDLMVWNHNPIAENAYKSYGMTPQRTVYEIKI